MEEGLDENLIKMPICSKCDKPFRRTGKRDKICGKCWFKAKRGGKARKKKNN